MVTEKKFKEIGQSQTSPVDNKKRKTVDVKVPKSENIIFIGSEHYYDSFWLKMMFIGAAYAKVKHLQFATKKTIAYVDDGYTKLEKLTLENLRNEYGFELVKLESSSDVIALLNRDRENYKLQDVAFFCHGIIGAIDLNYQNKRKQAIRLDLGNFSSVNKSAFLATGRIFSYACRTGVAVDDYRRGFASESDAQPENSLAQKMASHFNIEVHAFLRRSHYGGVLRVKSQSGAISAKLRADRETMDGSVIDIPPEHEALPHPGLAESWLPMTAPEREGTDGYALWRKNGGLALPAAGDTPIGLPADFRIFKPAT
jgi:hypothetical protein